MVESVDYIQAVSLLYASTWFYNPSSYQISDSPQEFDINKMDPEPGRCRRTDGKKWRCKKNVVSGQKYCEQHKHGGRQCSRKPVEASQTITASNATPLKNSSKTSQNPNASDCTSTTAVLSNGTHKSHKNYGNACNSVDAKIIGCTTKAVIVVSC
ncbi:hypothetical protein P3X46_014677 [Hevea brasiliensis]|uniref:Growth-regulating factor n=1 Tax=Hevea brasiliensis TaxID=3981 RepID=A0ABQ9LUR3_HEVBR|nr:hypothetical protein P3X46_014677 [Hevea brasiliensis]